MRMLVDAVGQEPALIKADIAGRCADQPRDGMALHVFRHVEAQELDAHGFGELACHLGLAHAGGAGEEIAADGLFRFAQAGPRQLDRRCQRLDGLVLPEHHPFEVAGEVAQRSASFFDTVRGGMRAMVATVSSISLTDDSWRCFRQQHLGGAGLVDHVDRLSGSFGH